MRHSIRITLSARLVDQFGGPFSTFDRTFRDGKSALSEIVSFAKPDHPTVLRVAVEGDHKNDKTAYFIQGDWLFDPDLAEPMPVDPPKWSYDEESLEWSSDKAWLEAWERCTHAPWMLYAAARITVDPRLVVEAACTCARSSIDFVLSQSSLPREALQIAESWVTRQATDEQVRHVAERCRLDRRSYDATMTAENLAAKAAFAACQSAAAETNYHAEKSIRSAVKQRVAYARHAATAALSARGAFVSAALANGARPPRDSTVSKVHRSIDTLTVLRAAAHRRDAWLRTIGNIFGVKWGSG